MPTPTDARPDWKSLHLWQIQPVRDGLVLAALFGLLYLGYVLSLVTVPILLALALAYLVEPLVRRLTRGGRVGRPMIAAAFIVLVTIVVVVPVGVGGAFAVVQGGKLAQRVAHNIDALVASVQRPEDGAARAEVVLAGRSWVRLRDSMVEQERLTKAWREARAAAAAGQADPDARPTPPPEPSDLYRVTLWVSQWVKENASALGKSALDVTGGVAGGVAGAALSTVTRLSAILFGAFLTAFFFFFFCTGYGKVLAFWERLIPEKRKGRAIDLLAQMDAVIAGFVRGRLTICAAMIGVYTLGFYLIGVPAPLIVGPIVGLLTIVPYAAGAVGIPLAMLLLWLEPGAPLGAWQTQWWWVVLGPLLVTGVVQFLDDYVLTPRIQGKTTNMDTPTILFASIAGGALAGFYGMLLAIPVAACIKILVKEIVWPQFQAWSQGKARDVLPIGRE
ncbi:MAG: hypothetical protein HBSAPP03_18190 [Phycisphaerae bacterium]|nr:MAG: hypothetical protein HBSAPP03_18190 [Phycisphaerae bacterium]